MNDNKFKQFYISLKSSEAELEEVDIPKKRNLFTRILKLTGITVVSCYFRKNTNIYSHYIY